jgi:hypothetical protein
MQWSDESIYEALVTPILIDSSQRAKCQILLRDFLTCASAGISELPASVDHGRGGISTAVLLAKSSSFHDLDDVDWKLLTHPGSIVNSAALAAVLECGGDLNQLVPAMVYGYGAAHFFASTFESSHNRKWHATATAGIFGAALAAAKLFNLDRQQSVNAINFAAIAVGGAASAPFAQNGATRFTKAQAAAMGLLAAIEAKAGSPVAPNCFSGPGGLISRFDIRENLPSVQLQQGLTHASLRFYPWSGFMHDALNQLTQILPIDSKSVLNVQINLPENFYALVGSSAKGPWWSIADAISSTLISGDPMRKLDLTAIKPNFEVAVSKWDASFGNIEIETSEKKFSIEFSLPASSGFSPKDKDQVESKWRNLNSAQFFDLERISIELTSVNPNPKILKEVRDLLKLN